VGVNQQLFSESTSCNSHPNVPCPKAPRADGTFPVAYLDGSLGEECTRPHVTAEVMVDAFELESDPCHFDCLGSDQFISGIEYYTRCDVFRWHRVCFIYVLCIDFILFTVLWVIMHESNFASPAVEGTSL
jgi:hypothetical protein